MEIVDAPQNSNLRCHVCNQLFNSPKYLSCGHFYCKGCLEQLVVQSKITCPRCRRETDVSAGGVTELDTNAFINQVVLVCNGAVTNPKCGGSNQMLNTDVECEPATSVCFECKMFLCEYCRYYHQRDKTNSHTILSLNDAPESHMNTIPLCIEHGYELKRYCDTCNELVCAYCTRGKHKTHDYDTVETMASKHRDELKQITAPVHGMVRNISDTLTNIDNMKKTIGRQGSEVKQEIDRHYEMLVQNLMMQKEELKQQVDNIVLQKEQALTVQKGEVDPLHRDLVQIKQQSESLDRISDQEVLSEKQDITDNMQRLNIYCRNLSKHPVQSATVEYVPTKESFPQFGQLFVFASPRTSEITNLPKSNSVFLGERIQATIITKDCNGVPCSKGGCKISAELKSVNGNVTIGEVQDKNDGSYTISVAGKEIGKAKLSVFINGYQLEGSPCMVTVIGNYQAMKLPSTILNNNGTMGELWGAASGKNGVWGVADNSNHCMYIFDARDKLIRRFGSHGRDRGQLNSPHGVTFDHDNNLYVADSSNHRVKKFDTNGNYLLQFKGHGSGESQLQYPYGVAVHNDQVYVADRDNHRIAVFQITGRFSFSFGAEKLTRPYDVIVNVNNQLYVINNDQHCIKMFTLDGHYVGKFGTQGSGKGQLNEPYCLGTDLNGFILVSDHNHRVSVYDCTGCFIHCFGACGSGNSQFKYPRGVAVSQTGSIYVCDEDNHRVQIFSSYW